MSAGDGGAASRPSARRGCGGACPCAAAPRLSGPLCAGLRARMRPAADGHLPGRERVGRPSSRRPLGDTVQEELRAICGAAPTADDTVRILVDGTAARTQAAKGFTGAEGSGSCGHQDGGALQTESHLVPAVQPKDGQLHGSQREPVGDEPGQGINGTRVTGQTGHELGRSDPCDAAHEVGEGAHGSAVPSPAAYTPKTLPRLPSPQPLQPLHLRRVARAVGDAEHRAERMADDGRSPPG